MAGTGTQAAAPARAFTLTPYSYAEALTLVEQLELAEPIAVALVRRGYRTVQAARAFLEAGDDHDPFEFDGMAEVVERLRAAIAEGKRITVHGDYDVDGVCATAILVRSLRAIGGDSDWFIPGRLDDGYGLTVGTVQALAGRGTEVLITVDCGITSAAEIDAARAAGMEAIVTDHHQPEDVLPECPTLHPLLGAYPCPELCAAGVAYKLAAALRDAEAVARELDLVALATVADLVPLRGENRALVRRGLAVARQARRPGTRALMASARVAPERLDEGDLAFRLAPRINAAGRLYRADGGVELMLTDDPARAEEIAAELERANGERRAVEATVIEGAERALRAMPSEQAEAPGLVIAGEGWHPGVVGIVASRLAERYWRPVVLVALEGDRARGSGRSIQGFDLLEALRGCDEHLLRYGGHRAAAGVELDPSRLDAFREAFAERVAAALRPEDLVRTEPVDAVVGGESLGHEVAEQLERMAPFGIGNPDVRLLVPSATLSDVRPMGEGGRHARFSLRSGPRRALGVAFGVNGKLERSCPEPIDISVSLELNEWNGAVEPRVVLSTLFPRKAPTDARDAARSHDLPESEFWRRFDAELERDLEDWPPAHLADPNALESGRRRVVDRRRASGVAAVAGLASSGEAVLVLCADALRRRALIERAARPAIFGGGEMALASARSGEAGAREAVAALREPGRGVALVDWPALALWPDLMAGFAHIVVVDPPPFEHLAALARGGAGYLHLLGGGGDVELALRAHAEEWPQPASLRRLYRELKEVAGNAGTMGAADALGLLRGSSHAYPQPPETVARRLRVLEDLSLVRWSRSGADRELGVVSSVGTQLELSPAFVAYRARYEEGIRYLSEPTPSS